MKILDYINFEEIFKKVKENHLEQYPTAKSFQEDFYGSSDWADGMYNFLNNKPEDANIDMHEWEDMWAINVSSDTLKIELTVGGNNATENGDDYWGYGWIFTIDLENELFVGFEEENYS